MQLKQKHQIKQLRAEYRRISGRIRNKLARPTDVSRLEQIDGKLSKLMPNWGVRNER